MKPKTLTIHKDIWKAWQVMADKVKSGSYGETPEQYLYFVEQEKTWVWYCAAGDIINVIKLCDDCVCLGEL